MDEAKFDAICDRYATTSESSRTILAYFHVSADTFYRSLDNPLFAMRYARAKERRAETLTEEAILIADTEPDNNRARNRIGIRQWLAERLHRRAYGQQVDITSGGEPLDLSGARQRALSVRPVRDQLDIVDAEVIEDKRLTLSLAPGCAPVTAGTRDAVIVQDESRPPDLIDPFA